MAVFGTYGDISRLLGDVPLFAEALDYLRLCLAKGTEPHGRLSRLDEGGSFKAELADGVFAIESCYPSRPRSDCFFETHRRYIDVQAIIEGEEYIEVADIARLRASGDYIAERDLTKYQDFDFASRLRLTPGDLAIFFPTDGHMPCLQIGTPSRVRKTVVKIPVPSVPGIGG